MRLFLLICVTMIAFAANSVLARMGMVDTGEGAASGPMAFAALRIGAGALMLAGLVAVRSAPRPTVTLHSMLSALWLTLYVLTFSLAYLTLDAGAGALILFGMVQMTMFSAAVLKRDPLGWTSFAGAGLAFAGLAYLLWPGGTGAPDLFGALLMAASGIGWGLYTLAGRGNRDPLGGTALAFGLAVPLCLIALLIWPDGMSWSGALTAVLSGAVTSALGYALWYYVLPQITAASAAVAQLTVPLIATLGGALVLFEPLTLRFVLSSAVVLSGIALTVWGQNRQRRA